MTCDTDRVAVDAIVMQTRSTKLQQKAIPDKGTMEGAVGRVL